MTRFEPERSALIADDHALFRTGIAAMLTDRCGITRVLEASSFDDGLAVLCDVPFVSLAIFDLSMPGMASAASLRAVRHRFPSPRVVVMTGSHDRQDILVALQSGVHGFIYKTLGVDDICSALRHVLGGQIYVPPDLAVCGTEPPDALGAGDPPPRDVRLSRRQRQVLDLMRIGWSNKKIARSMDLSENTVKVHANAVFRACGVTNRRALPPTADKPSNTDTSCKPE